MDEGEGHAGEAMVEVDQFVEEDDTDGRGKVEYNADGYSHISLAACHPES